METRLAKFVQEFPGRLALPIASYAGLEITGESVEDLVSVPGSQFKAIMALADRYSTPVMLTAIDTTAEAEAYGSEIKFSTHEAPTIVGRLVTNAADAAALPDPVAGDARTRVPIETAWRLTAEVGESVPVLGAMLGPFALASRLFGIEETLEAMAAEPETIETLLDNVTGFLCRYALEFRETGAWGVVVAEGTAGRLSPEGAARFSAPFVKRIIKAVETPDFAVVVHSCHASIDHLDGLLVERRGILSPRPVDRHGGGPRPGRARRRPGRQPPPGRGLPEGDGAGRGRGDEGPARGHASLQELHRLVRLRHPAGRAARQSQRVLPRRRRIQQIAQSPIATASRYHAAWGSHCSAQRQSSSLPVSA